LGPVDAARLRPAFVGTLDPPCRKTQSGPLNPCQQCEFRSLRAPCRCLFKGWRGVNRGQAEGSRRLDLSGRHGSRPATAVCGGFAGSRRRVPRTAPRTLGQGRKFHWLRPAGSGLAQRAVATHCNRSSALAQRWVGVRSANRAYQRLCGPRILHRTARRRRTGAVAGHRRGDHTARRRACRLHSAHRNHRTQKRGTRRSISSSRDGDHHFAPR